MNNQFSKLYQSLMNFKQTVHLKLLYLEKNITPELLDALLKKLPTHLTAVDLTSALLENFEKRVNVEQEKARQETERQLKQPLESTEYQKPRPFWQRNFTTHWQKRYRLTK